jgi:hypothetical protein
MRESMGICLDKYVIFLIKFVSMVLIQCTAFNI